MFDYQNMSSAFASSDAKTLKKMYQPCHQDLMLYCLGKFKDYELAQDAASETLMKLLEHQDPTQIPNLKAWMLTVARNACLKVIATKNRREGILDSISLWISGKQRAAVYDKLNQESIDLMIRSVLNEKDQKIWSYEEQGYQEEEIAEFLKISSKTIANRRSMIKKKIKDQLAEYCLTTVLILMIYIRNPK